MSENVGFWLQKFWLKAIPRIWWVGKKNLALITMKGQWIVDCHWQSKTMTNCHAFKVRGNSEFVLAMVFPPSRRILQSEKCVDCVNQNFWSVSDTTDRPKIYFRLFVSNPPHTFLYHKALTKQRTDGHHELFHRAHRLFFWGYWQFFLSGKNSLHLKMQHIVSMSYIYDKED